MGRLPRLPGDRQAWRTRSLAAIWVWYIGYFSLAALAQSQYLEGVMYQGMPVSGCIRTLTAEATYGCQGSAATTGILYGVFTSAELDAFVNDAPSGKFAVVMPYAFFTLDNINRLEATKKMSGMILVKDGFNFPPPSNFSIDSTCPNCEYGLYANQSKETWTMWNPSGRNLAFQNFDFPIFGITGYPGNLRSISPLRQALESNILGKYRDYPQYAVQFDSFMFADVDSGTCLRRDRCDPIGGLSVWSSFSSLAQGTTMDSAKPIIVVASKLDSRAFMFDFSFALRYSTGPSTPVFAIGAAARTGLVTALATADALSKYFQQPAATPLAKQILFTFFDAEVWGYAGSQRFVQDITTPFQCKERSSQPTAGCPITSANCTNPCFYDLDFESIKFDNIESIIEFDSVGGSISPDQDLSNTNIYMHVDVNNTQNAALMSTFGGTVSSPGFNGSTALSVNVIPAATAAGNLRLPPSSAMAFLAKKNIPAIVLGDYQRNFSNKFYNSEFDDGRGWDADNIALMCALANKTARTLFTSASGTNASAPSVVSANCTLIASLMECMTRNLLCDLVSELYPPLQKLKDLGLLHDTAYSGRFNYDTNVVPFLISRFMANLTSLERKNTCVKDSDCENADFVCTSYQNTDNGTSIGQCVKGFSRFHWAYGTGIERNYERGIFEVVDPKKPTWTQSRFRDYAINNSGIRLRIFKVASSAYEGLQLGIGIAFTILGIAGTLFARRFLRKRFKTD
ncbi:Nicastrin-domain-containing protein [Phlyctochytrium arcticum]|nr:Nicastrin-domain-containing protein [Phlyctochytrium arcticum]